MVEFILFILIIIVGAYALTTRQKLQQIATAIDQVHAEIDKAFGEDRQRITRLENHKVKKV